MARISISRWEISSTVRRRRGMEDGGWRSDPGPGGQGRGRVETGETRPVTCLLPGPAS